MKTHNTAILRCKVLFLRHLMSALLISGLAFSGNTVWAAESIDLDELLAEAELMLPEVESERCLARHKYKKVDILDREHLLFFGRGEEAWLNRLGNRCVGLRRDMVLVFKVSGPRLCNLDRVSGRERSGFANFESAVCSLGKFEPITKQHALALKQMFKDQRKSRRKKK